MMTVKTIMILGALLLCSCTTVKFDKEKLVDEFGSNYFTLNRTMYHISYLNCAPVIGAYEDKTSEIVFLDEVFSDDISRFEAYRDLKAGDKNCNPSKDIRIHTMLDVGEKVEVISVRDIANASWWLLEVKGYVVINNKKQFFRMELPFGKGKSIPKTLSRAFYIE